ncbi:CDP-glycerol glycerophosphotransferase family protein [Helicobacter jaachi]|uniref:CDP-glycerol glycerophosphotransferase family protein n=1 Tax=Helicobacter jaachi TaxID=1677920 RepID=UPI001EE7B029|nr:CDP-glycerol glycerophosphotransferase family protein [Helicobacter jaachi]
MFVLTTPGLDVLHIKRNRGVAHYCHIVHSLSPMTYRVFGVDYFDSVLVANAVQRDFVRDIESAHNVRAKYIAITGSTYLDELSNAASHIKQDINSSAKSQAPTILVAPSWGKETLLSKYGLELLLPLAQTQYNIIIRPHPQSFISPRERENIHTLQNTLKSYDNVQWDEGTPNILAFARADMMISDFSSVIFDFVCLEGKPVITIDNDMDLSGYDMADINRDSIWTFKALDRIGGRIKAVDFPRIKELVDSALYSHAQSIDEIKALLWQHPHHAGMVSALELLKIEREVIESRLKAYIQPISRLRELDKMIEQGVAYA